jgi:hypothetical protein
MTQTPFLPLPLHDVASRDHVRDAMSRLVGACERLYIGACSTPLSRSAYLELLGHHRLTVNCSFFFEEVFIRTRYI